MGMWYDYEPGWLYFLTHTYSPFETLEGGHMAVCHNFESRHKEILYAWPWLETNLHTHPVNTCTHNQVDSIGWTDRRIERRIKRQGFDSERSGQADLTVSIITLTEKRITYYMKDKVQCVLLKGTVHPKICILSLFTFSCYFNRKWRFPFFCEVQKKYYWALSCHSIVIYYIVSI